MVRDELAASLGDVLTLLDCAPPESTEVVETVEKAGDGPGPKAPAPAGSAPDWPGWKLDGPAAAYWAPKVRSAVTAAVPKATARQIGADYLAAHPGQDGSAAGKRDRNKAAAAWLAAWLAQRGVKLVPDATAEGIATDGYLIGAASAASVTDGQPVDTGNWKPGGTSSAQKRIDQLGMAAALSSLLGRGGAGEGAEAAEDAGEPVASGYTGSLAIILAGTDADWADSEDTLDELGGMLSDALADDDLAVTLVGTQINIWSGLAAHEYYMANANWVQWVTDPSPTGPCAMCQANQDNSPVRVGQPFDSGHTSTPGHDHCRCAVLPALPPAS